MRWLTPSIVTVLRRDARAGDHAASRSLRRAAVLPVVTAWPALAAEVRAAHPGPPPDDGGAGYPPSPGRRAALPPAAPATLHLDTVPTDAELEPLYQRIVLDLRSG